MRAFCFAFLAIAAFSALATAQAQPASGAADDLQNGRYLADLVCSICHVTGPDQSVEPVLHPPAPSFEAIAQRSTTSAHSIRTFLTTTHRDISNPAGMPNPELLDFQIRQIETYLLSLREPSASAPPIDRAQAACGPGRWVVQHGNRTSGIGAEPSTRERSGGRKRARIVRRTPSPPTHR